MDDLHLKGNIYHGKETVEQSSSGCIGTVLVSFVPVCVYVCVCCSPAVFVLYPLGNTVGDHPCPMGLLVRCLGQVGRSDGTL